MQMMQVYLHQARKAQMWYLLVTIAVQLSPAMMDQEQETKANSLYGKYGVPPFLELLFCFVFLFLLSGFILFIFWFIMKYNKHLKKNPGAVTANKSPALFKYLCKTKKAQTGRNYFKQNLFAV